MDVLLQELYAALAHVFQEIAEPLETGEVLSMLNSKYQVGIGVNENTLKQMLERVIEYGSLRKKSMSGDNKECTVYWSKKVFPVMEKGEISYLKQDLADELKTNAIKDDHWNDLNKDVGALERDIKNLQQRLSPPATTPKRETASSGVEDDILKVLSLKTELVAITEETTMWETAIERVMASIMNHQPDLTASSITSLMNGAPVQGDNH